MVNYRSILSLILALITAFWLNVNSVEAARAKKPLTYTSQQIEQLQGYAGELQVVRDRFSELEALIDKEDWTFTSNFIHGPLGELRFKLASVVRTLLPSAQAEARSLSKEVFGDLNAIEMAAQSSDYKAATRGYVNLTKDLDAFLMLIPKA
jgi:photosystem II protein PsbQ